MKKPDPGMVVSSVAHAAVIAYAVIGWSSAKPFDAAPEALAVEVMTSSEFDKLAKGEKTSKTVAEKPKVEAKKVAAATPEPRPPAPEAKENVEAPPPPPEPEKVEAPEPPKPEPKPEPKQAEKPPTPAPTPKPAELPEPEKKADEAKLDDLIKKEVEKKPEPKPEPKKAEKKPPEKPKPKFDPTKIAALVDKRDPGRVAQEAPEISNITTAGISNGAQSQLELSTISRINAMVVEQVRQCWSPPVGAAGATDLAVVVQFRLGQDGGLQGDPRVMNSSGNAYFQSAADSATRAVRMCSPLKLPIEFYEHWKFVEINFDPRQMMGG